jgi:hypothetical protein
VKKLSFLVLICAVILAGCFPEGEGKGELIKANPVQGPAGDEVGDQTAPVGQAAYLPDGSTNSAFPSNDFPAPSGK